LSRKKSVEVSTTVFGHESFYFGIVAWSFPLILTIMAVLANGKKASSESYFPIVGLILLGIGTYCFWRSIDALAVWGRITLLVLYVPIMTTLMLFEILWMAGAIYGQFL